MASTMYSRVNWHSSLAKSLVFPHVLRVRTRKKVIYAQQEAVQVIAGLEPTPSGCKLFKGKEHMLLILLAPVSLSCLESRCLMNG